MENTGPFLMTMQSYWENQIYNFVLPDWHRLFCLAVARSAPNLHAEFQPGQMATMMGRIESDILLPMKPPRLSNVIAQAVERRLLDETSNARCLVLPSSAWKCNLMGNRAPCATHYGKESRPRRFRGSKSSKIDNQERMTSVSAGQRVLVSF